MPVPSRPSRLHKYFADAAIETWTTAQRAELARMRVFRSVWSPTFGYGFAVGQYGIPPGVVPVVAFDSARDRGEYRPVNPAGLCYLS